MDIIYRSELAIKFPKLALEFMPVINIVLDRAGKFRKTLAGAPGIFI